MKKLFIVICAVFIAGTSFATEAGYLYGGLDYMAVKYEYNISSDFLGESDSEVDIGVLRARFGYYFLSNFAIEGMYGVGVEDGKYEYFGVELDFELEEMFGIFLLGEYPATDYLKFYAIAGFSSVEVQYSAKNFGPAYEFSQEDTIFSVSIGLEIQPIKNLGITIEYSELLDEFYELDEVEEAKEQGFEIDYDMSAISLGFKYYF